MQFYVSDTIMSKDRREIESIRSNRIGRFTPIICPIICALFLASIFAISFIVSKLLYDYTYRTNSFCTGRKFDMTKLYVITNNNTKISITT